jgi:hypothetical protein
VTAAGPPVLRGIRLARRFGATPVLRGADVVVHGGEVVAASAASRPLLRRVTTGPDRD